MSVYMFACSACVVVYPPLNARDMEWLIQLLVHLAFIML